MQQLINFFLRNKNVLLFLFLFAVSLALTIQSHSYHKSKFLHSANGISGGIYNITGGLGQYFSLKEENGKLVEENNRLKTILFQKADSIPELKTTLDVTLYSASVIKNSYALSNNFLTINKGRNDSIQEDFGVITAKGIVGVIDNVSNNYGRVLSILNTTSRISAMLNQTNHFGELKWDGVSPEIVQLVDLPKQAPIKAGDTIITSGRSFIFPKGIPIGTIVDFALDETANFYTINVALFNDMANIGHVHVIKNNDKEEIQSLEQPNE